MEKLKPITTPGTHKLFLEYFLKMKYKTNTNILDLGAGHGAFSKILHELNYDIKACDLFPELFKYNKVEFKKANLSEELPYANNSFDLIIAIEVCEHILNHDNLFRELNRILKPGGAFIMTTPNILSLKSRIRFFLKGEFYSFIPLQMNNLDGMQHISSLTPDQYNYIATKNGFRKAQISIDKIQKSSLILFFFLIPFIVFTKSIHNLRILLTGRKLFLKFNKAIV